MRVYELAKELGIQSKDLLVTLKSGGFSASSHMAVLSDEAIQFIEKNVSKKEAAQLTSKAKAAEPQKMQEKMIEIKAVPVAKPVVEPKLEEKLEGTEAKVAVVSEVNKLIVSAESFEDFEAAEIREQERIRRLLQTKGLVGSVAGLQQGPRRRRRRRSRPAAVRPQEAVRGPVTEVTIERTMAVFEVADLFNKSSGDLILILLKKGMACNRNHMLSVDQIREMGHHFGITVHVKKPVQPEAGHGLNAAAKPSAANGQTRWPIVVVMGHVDHGKTTLLDYIRKMNVAATEKGGITQHIRAWEVESTHGKIVFLDTPGHEAFSYLRQRGSKVTDVVVLVVAADDGVKPQTVEAIKHAKEAGVPIIVAINKIDRMQSPSALETVKRQLAQYELMPEEWGGSTIIVPISAKTGKGVEELLEMIVLQSQMMDLKADNQAAARAFVLESHIEKGFGPVATVVCKEGILKQGDYFVCGAVTGKVRILVNSLGKKVTQAYPSTPVQVVGFDTFVGVGDWLAVVPQQEYSRAKSRKGTESTVPLAAQAAVVQETPGKKQSGFINLIIKTDTRGSQEAVMDSVDKVIKKHKDIKCPVNIVTSAIGDITEGDIDLAKNTSALILGLHVRVEKNAQMLAKDYHVKVQTYQIIYELIDFVDQLIESKREVVTKWVKVGEATVKKVFDIKGIGIIAGCYMRDGVLARGDKVICERRSKQLGEGKVVTLQRERKTVKEVHAGYECGFTTEGFTEWQEGDTVLCFAERKAE